MTKVAGVETPAKVAGVAIPARVVSVMMAPDVLFLNLNDSPANDAAHIDLVSDLALGVAKNFDGIATSTTSGTGVVGGCDVFDGTNDYLAASFAGFAAAGVGASQQGITTDGTNIYISSTTNIYKYSPAGTLLATSDASVYHIGGLCYYNGFIYAAVSECPGAGGTAIHYVYKYDPADLSKDAEWDMTAHFDMCLGAIAYWNGNFYLGESTWDDVTDDYIVKLDTSFNLVGTFTLNYQSSNGIQGLEYIPWLNKFRVNSHGTGFYFIDPDFDDTSIITGTAPFNLQDLAVSGRRVIYNNRDAQTVVISDENTAANGGITTQYTAMAWFNLAGGAGARRCIFESYPTNWSISCEISASNLLKYGVMQEAIPASPGGVIAETNITPGIGEWHHVAITYIEGGAIKIYYDGAELAAYAGVSYGALQPFTGLYVGTYRVADDRYFNGSIDEVRLVARALSAAEILAEYRRG